MMSLIECFKLFLESVIGDSHNLSQFPFDFCEALQYGSDSVS